MIDNGKRLKELIRKRGFRIGAVAEAIDVAPSTMDRWTDNAPIGKLIKLSRFTGIPILEVISCFDIEDESRSGDDVSVEISTDINRSRVGSFDD